MFKAGDKIKMLESCTGCYKGEIYILKNYGNGVLYACNEHSGGCECEDKWELVNSIIINVRELNKSIKMR